MSKEEKKAEKIEAEVESNLPEGRHKGNLAEKIGLLQSVPTTSDLDTLRSKPQSFSQTLEVNAFLDKLGIINSTDDIPRVLAAAGVHSLCWQWSWCFSKIRQMESDLDNLINDLYRAKNEKPTKTECESDGKNFEAETRMWRNYVDDKYDEAHKKANNLRRLVSTLKSRTSKILGVSPHFQEAIRRAEDKLSESKVTVTIGPPKGFLNVGQENPV